LFFFDSGQKPKQVIASVKAGKVQVSHVRDLVGVLAREKAEIGVLISSTRPLSRCDKEAAAAGFYTSLGHNYPRVQLLTSAELLDRKRIQMPIGCINRVRPWNTSISSAIDFAHPTGCMRDTGRVMFLDSTRRRCLTCNTLRPN
jgi:hypothetical protein